MIAALRQWVGKWRRRLALRKLAGAEHSDLLADWIVGGASANQELRGDLRLLRNRARDLAKNESTTRQFLRLLKSNVIGPNGIKMQARCRLANGTLRKQLNDQIEAAWQQWCKRPTAAGRGSLTTLQHLLIRTLAADGETLIVMHDGFDNPHAFAIEALDAALLDHEFHVAARDGQNAVDLGVERNAFGRPVAYYFRDTATGAARHRRIEASRIIHLYMQEFVDQARGISWLNSTVKPMRHFDGYVEAELVAARAGAAKLGVAKANDLFNENTPLLDTKMRFKAGTLQMLPPGYELDGWSPDHPNDAFPAFTKAALRQIACGLGVSYNALANDLEGVNYSSMRSGLLIERDEWRCLQQWWIEEFLQPIFERWLTSALFVGAVTGEAGQRPTPEMFNVKWRPRGWAWVDPLKDTNAGVVAVNNILSSREALLAETGDDFEDTIEQLAEEKRLLDQYGIQLPPPPGAANAANAGAPADESGDDKADANRFASAWSLQ